MQFKFLGLNSNSFSVYTMRFYWRIYSKYLCFLLLYLETVKAAANNDGSSGGRKTYEWLFLSPEMEMKARDHVLDVQPEESLTILQNQTARSSNDPSQDPEGQSSESIEARWDSNDHFQHSGRHDNATIVTIAVMGRSGSGVSSTIRELLGPSSTCSMPDGNETFQNIMEYVINIPSTDISNERKLKLLDIPGLVDGRRVDEEAQILASLKFIVQNTSPPDFYLAISKFDDNRFDGEYSDFVKFLKRVQLFHDIFPGNATTKTNNTGSSILFLLTHLMSVVKPTQRKPDTKIDEFKKVIEKFTTLPSPISVIVGDNMALAEHEAPVEKGYYKLPNKQLYPENIWEAFITQSPDTSTKDMFTTIMNSRETGLECERKLISTEWKFYNDDADAFSYLLSQKNTTVINTEINKVIDDVFTTLKHGQQMQAIVQKIALQLGLRQENITIRADLPQSQIERVKFFQKNKHFSVPISTHILKKAFSIEMPEFIPTPQQTIGYGYDVMEDEISPRSPFKTDKSKNSPIGYRLPNFIKCEKLIRPQIEHFKSYSANMAEYFEERSKYLHLKNKGIFTGKGFVGKVKEGFNLKPEEGQSVHTLTAVEERRVLICQLVPDRDKWVLDPEFIESVKNLEEFDKHNKDTVVEWKSWFSTWGSHIVVQGYGGGKFAGSIVGGNVKNVLKSRSDIDATLNAIVEFAPFPAENLGTPSYRFYGGESETQSESLYALEEVNRKELIEKWEESLNYDFIMLTNEFKLDPISVVVKENIEEGMSKAEMIDRAIVHLLKGELKYERKKRVRNQNRGGD